MNKKIIKIMAACIITMVLVCNGMSDICYAMNKTEIGRADAGEASVVASVTTNGSKTSWNASSSETSDFRVEGVVYDKVNYNEYLHSAYQTSAYSSSETWSFEPTFTNATFDVSGYTGDCVITLTITE